MALPIHIEAMSRTPSRAKTLVLQVIASRDDSAELYLSPSSVRGAAGWGILLGGIVNKVLTHLELEFPEKTRGYLQAELLGELLSELQELPV